MPWSAQVCPCCKKRYANKTGLYNHLVWYVGEWRLPADGVHDVLKCSQTLRRLNPNAIDEDDGNQYRCWTCPDIFKSRRRFQEHVIYRGHCHEVPRVEAPPKKRGRSWRAWVLPFDEEHVLIKDRKFPFLKLPLDLRVMVYELVLYFGNIFLSDVRKYFQEPRPDGRWLQHNPDANVLAIMSTSRQVYHEARSIFYGFNTFIFEQMRTIPIFLVGIGVQNTMCLRSVKCHGSQAQLVNLVAEIKACVTQEPSSEGPLHQPELIWNPELLYDKFLTDKMVHDAGYWDEFRCFVRPNDTEPSQMWSRYRHSMWFYLQNVSGKKKPQGGTVTYELCVQRRVMSN